MPCKGKENSDSMYLLTQIICRYQNYNFSELQSTWDLYDLKIRDQKEINSFFPFFLFFNLN